MCLLLKMYELRGCKQFWFGRYLSKATKMLSWAFVYKNTKRHVLKLGFLFVVRISVSKDPHIIYMNRLE